MHTLNRRIQSVALAIGVVVSLGGLTAIAQDNADTAQPNRPGHGKMHQGKHHHGCGVMKQLNLTDEQKARMKTMHESFKQENAALIESMRARHQQLKALGRDEANQEQRQQLIQAMKQDRQTLMGKKKAQLQQILSPEQMSQLEAAHAQCKAQWQTKKKNHQGHDWKKHQGPAAGNGES